MEDPIARDVQSYSRHPRKTQSSIVSQRTEQIAVEKDHRLKKKSDVTRITKTPRESSSRFGNNSPTSLQYASLQQIQKRKANFPKNWVYENESICQNCKKSFSSCKCEKQTRQLSQPLEHFDQESYHALYRSWSYKIKKILTTMPGPRPSLHDHGDNQSSQIDFQRTLRELWMSLSLGIKKHFTDISLNEIKEAEGESHNESRNKKTLTKAEKRKTFSDYEQQELLNLILEKKRKHLEQKQFRLIEEKLQLQREKKLIKQGVESIQREKQRLYEEKKYMVSEKKQLLKAKHILLKERYLIKEVRKILEEAILEKDKSESCILYSSKSGREKSRKDKTYRDYNYRITNNRHNLPERDNVIDIRYGRKNHVMSAVDRDKHSIDKCITLSYSGEIMIKKELRDVEKVDMNEHELKYTSNNSTEILLENIIESVEAAAFHNREHTEANRSKEGLNKKAIRGVEEAKTEDQIKIEEV